MRLTLTILLFPVALMAATIDVENPPTYESASNALYSASAGDTLSFPTSGAATWTNTLEITKAVSIVGNGTTLTSGIALVNGLLHFNAITNSSALRITGLTFILDGHSGYRAAILVDNVDLSNLRIDHCYFDEGVNVVELSGCMGVVDHCAWTNSLKSLSILGGAVWQQWRSWETVRPGTADAMFAEDNLFLVTSNYPSAYFQEAIGTAGGGKIVVRNNEFDADDSPLAGGETALFFGPHGSAAGGATNAYWQSESGARRCQSVLEQYRNNIHGYRLDYILNSRGGSCLYWSNAITYVYAAENPAYQKILLREEEYSVSDQWVPLRTTWPAEDQVHNSYFWGNSFNGSNQWANIVTTDAAGQLQENRDYWLHAPEATGGCEYFTGLNGASDTFPTDGNTYPTLGTMAFTASGTNAYYGYVPYTYPHPLTVEAATTRNIRANTLRVGKIR